MQRVQNKTLIPPNHTVQSLRRFVRLKIVAPYMLAALFLAVACALWLTDSAENTQLTLVVAALLAFIFGGMAYAIANRVSRPLEAMLDSVEQLTYHHSLNANPSLTAPPNLNQTLTDFGAINVQIRQLAHLRTLLTRYLGGDIAQRILDGETHLGGEEICATALFVDIRDFTSLTETTDVGALFNELNEYYTVMQRAIARYGGVINKFGGDSILALFGAPTFTEDHALNAVLAAGAIMDELAFLNERRTAHGRPPFRIGIGVNTGEMMIGNLGSEQRLEYSVLGDCVNVAKRLSDLSKETPFYSIYVGQNSMDEISQLPTSWDALSLGEIAVKGRQEKIETFAVTPGEAAPIPDAKPIESRPAAPLPSHPLPEPALLAS